MLCARVTESEEESDRREQEQGLVLSWRTQLCPLEGTEVAVLSCINTRFLF